MNIRQDFEHPIAVIEMQVLGLLGKRLTVPCMQVFSTSVESELKGISVIKNVMTTLTVAVKNPCHIITRDTYFFGRLLSKNDDTLRKLQAEPSINTQFTVMVAACLNTVTSCCKMYSESCSAK